ncbi:uncharacterized protein LOC118755751 [Rhagoletis pomonella]|uniref:uncharacterized protein LOC118755751 n=1 Tax=Rhagoletis pomonella TaxID=28610 RepID=UPI00177CCA4E|nr:uncharacterized protein LOC118755751 [Rhagoletis pomonella]XP_036346469.1 uncharacterized protein LOC118755751 [Rhagoletis pomonella]
MDHSGTPTPAPRALLKSKVVMTPSVEREPSPGSHRIEEDYQRCRLCTRHHALRLCPVFASMQPQQRFLLARAHKYCTNCLALSHTTAECTSSGLCKVCSLQHHTLLHRRSTSTVRRSSPNAAVQPLKRLVQPKLHSPQRGGSGRTPARSKHLRHHPTATNVENRRVRRTKEGLQTANYRDKTTKLLVQEALRTLQELKEALSA